MQQDSCRIHSWNATCYKYLSNSQNIIMHVRFVATGLRAVILSIAKFLLQNNARMMADCCCGWFLAANDPTFDA